MKIGFEISLDSHYVNHANALLSNIPIFPSFAIETKCFSKILRKIATIYARLRNQNKCKYPILFSASFFKCYEEDRRSNEIEFFFSLKTNHNLTEIDINNNDIVSQLEHQIQI